MYARYPGELQPQTIAAQSANQVKEIATDRKHVSRSQQPTIIHQGPIRGVVVVVVTGSALLILDAGVLRPGPESQRRAVSASLSSSQAA